jgi:VWFA-related protein
MRKIYTRIFLSFLLTSCVLFAVNDRIKSSQAEEHEAIVRLVIVDVVATDKEGNFVSDLKKEDFEVYENGKRMPIDSFELVLFEKENILEEEKQISKSGQRFARKKRFIVIFDSINTIKRMIDRNKQPILENLISLIEQGREIMIFELSEKEGMKILQPFTSEERLIAQAVEKASGSIWVEKSSDALSVPSILSQADPGLEARGAGFDLGKFQKTQQHMYEFQSRNRFAKSINSFLAVMNVIKDYPGRKSVLLISGGFPALSFERIYAGDGIESTLPMAQVSAAKILDPFKVLQKTKSRDGDQIFNDLIQFANSHNITFYTMDPDNYLRYVLPDIAYDNFPRKMHSLDSTVVDNIAEIKKNEQSNLKYIAKDTGGTYLLGEKKFDNFKKVVSRDLGNYYELSYSPKKKKADGKYHKITVKAKTPGIDISFRRGYFDYTDEQKESLLFASAAYNPSIFKEIPFEARANTFVKGKDKYILWFNVALPMKKIITEDYDWGKSKILKLGIWIDETGGGSSLKSEMAIPIVLTPNLLERLKRVQFFGFNCSSDEVKLKKNEYKLVFALYDEAESKIGTVEQDLVIPNVLGLSESQVLTAVFGNLVQSSGGGNLKLSQKDGTLQLKEHKLYPMGSNMFRPRKDIGLFLQVYSQHKDIHLEPEFALIQMGEEKGTLPFRTVEQSWDENAKVWNCVYTLDFRSMPKGSYILEISWLDQKKEQESNNKIPLKII